MVPIIPSAREGGQEPPEPDHGNAFVIAPCPLILIGTEPNESYVFVWLKNARALQNWKFLMHIM